MSIKIKKKGGWSEEEDPMDQSLEEDDDEEVQAPLIPEVSKSGRVRKKSAKLLEMEEAEELEKQHMRRPEKAKAAPVKRSRPRPPDGVALAVTSAPVLETASTQGHSPQMRMLLTSGASPPPAKKPKVSSPKMMGTDIPVMSVNPVAALSVPPPPSSQEALKMKLQLGGGVEIMGKSPKKAKAKKEPVPSMVSVQPQAMLNMGDSGLEADTGLKLKFMLSPKEKPPIVPTGSPEGSPQKSTKKPAKKPKERSGDPESILQVKQNVPDLGPGEKSEKAKKKRKKKESDKDQESPEGKVQAPKMGSPSKPDLQTASLHLLAALSQATQAIPKSPAQLAGNRTPAATVAGSSPPNAGQVGWAPLNSAGSPVSVSSPPPGSAVAPLSSPEMEMRPEEGGEEEETPLVIDTTSGTSSKSAKKKKTKKDKVKEKSDPVGDLPGPDHVPGASPDHPVYADTNVMAKKVLTFAEKKAKGKKEHEGEKPKKKRKRGYTAYMLWCNSYRGKVVEQNPGIDFATISRRLGEIWHALPEKEKMSWKRQAKKLNAKGSTLISTGKAGSKGAAAAASTLSKAGASTGARVAPATPAAKPAASSAAHKAHSPNDELYLGMPGVSPVDVAAHLKLLGESLSIIGARLQEHQGLIAVQGSLSVLLDSMLCALAPLTCLTTQVPEVDGCPGATHSKTLDNVAYIMPGIG